MTIEAATRANLQSSIETPSLDERRAALVETFADLRSRLRDRPDINLPENARVVCMGWEKLMTAKRLPRRLKLLSRYAGVETDSGVLIAFNHCLEYDIIKYPSYSMSISWTRPKREEAAISELHFNVKENQSDTLDKFFASDSKTIYLSHGDHFPYPDGTPEELIPNEDREAQSQSETLNWLMEKEAFSLGVLEELTGIFK